MNREIGFALKVLQILADEQIPFEHMPSGIDSLSIVMRQDVFPRRKGKASLSAVWSMNWVSRKYRSTATWPLS